MNWPTNLRIKARYPLKNKTTFRIGGAAQYFSEPDNIAQLKLLISKATEKKLPIFILGAGSNLLVSDQGVKGLVLKLSAPYFKRISLKNNFIKAGSGVMLGSLVNFAKENSLQGLEFLAGIPGTLGGALAMNAGCWGFNIADLVKEVEIMDYSGNIKTLKRDEIRFAYRESGLKDCVILGAVLKLKPKDKKAIQNALNLYLKRRRSSQDSSYPNAGCIFRNPEDNSAGRLIDLCGLKGREKGCAIISTLHGNFILNKGRASAGDVLALMDIIQKQVKKKFGVKLNPEIRIWK